MSKRSGFRFELPTTMHVECSGPDRPSSVLVAYHGYAEQPRQLLERFESAGICERHLVVAPWGPHQFYNRQGEVVASWMTRWQREERVEQLCEHGRRLWRSVCESHGMLPLSLFGFSQGAANAYRVGLLAGLPVERIFALAGDIPPECRERLAELRGPAIVQLWGRQDDRVPLALQAADEQRLRAAGFPVEAHLADGGHELLPAILAEISRRLG